MLMTEALRYIAEEAPRPIWGTGMEVLPDTHRHAPHTHRQAQLVLTVRGLVTCEVANGLWMVPPQCALWIPGGMEHSSGGPGTVRQTMLFIDPDAVPGLPTGCCTVSVSPLLRELILAVAQLSGNYDRAGADGRLVHAMLDQLVAAPVQRLHLPLPADERLRRIAKGLNAHPADRATIGEWAQRVGMSERTLFRLVSKETGMSFGRWRQQFQIMLALERLAAGETVQAVAFDLGYESSSAFITMFKKALGQSPARYLAARRRLESEEGLSSSATDLTGADLYEDHSI